MYRWSTRPTIIIFKFIFKINRQSYYEHLQYAREKGDLEEWLSFFLKGVIYTAEQAVKSIQQTLVLLEDDRKILLFLRNS